MADPQEPKNAEPTQLTPYARSLGIEIGGLEDEIPLLTIAFSNIIEGRPGAFHGGATAGLLETAGYAALRTKLAAEGREAVLKPVNITVQYLSAGLPKQTYALGRIARLGRRSANVTVEAWQDNRDKLIASAVMNIMIAEPE
jgi:uncharacterized protein (TIGR00369 family)